MKVFYSTYTWQQARDKRLALEARWGIRFDYYGTRGGYGFSAIVTRETPSDMAAGKQLLSYLERDYRSFVYLADVSGMALSDVVAGAKALVYHQEAVATVNRNGHFAAIRALRPWERQG